MDGCNAGSRSTLPCMQTSQHLHMRPVRLLDNLKEGEIMTTFYYCGFDHQIYTLDSLKAKLQRIPKCLKGIYRDAEWITLGQFYRPSDATKTAICRGYKVA